MPAAQNKMGPANDRPGENDERISDFDPNRVADPDEDNPDLIVPENGAVLMEQADRGPTINRIGGDSPTFGTGTASGASIQAQINRGGPENGIGQD